MVSRKDGASIINQKLLNHIILSTKRMIFKYSCTNYRPPIPQEIKKRIIENRQEEKGISGGERHFNTSLPKMGQLPQLRTARQIFLSQTQTFYIIWSEEKEETGFPTTG